MSEETPKPAETQDALRQELEALRAENESLKKRGGTKELSFRVSAKGAVSVYGLGRFPVTLYMEQWQRLLKVGDDLRAFIRDNESALRKRAD